MVILFMLKHRIGNMLYFYLTEGRAVRQRALAAPGRLGRLCSGHEGDTYEHQLPVIQQLHATHRYDLFLYLALFDVCIVDIAMNSIG